MSTPSLAVASAKPWWQSKTIVCGAVALAATGAAQAVSAGMIPLTPQAAAATLDLFHGLAALFALASTGARFIATQTLR